MKRSWFSMFVKFTMGDVHDCFAASIEEESAANTSLPNERSLYELEIFNIVAESRTIFARLSE